MSTRAHRGLRLALLLGLASVAFAAPPADVMIVRVFPGWRNASSFKRISEYFTGQENTGGQVVLRSHPGERGGYYFLVRVKNPAAPQTVAVTLDVVRAGNAGAQTYTFQASLGTGDTVLNLGLTGADWVDPKADPLAWRLTLKGADGQTLATERSYLWEKPGGS
ncbi:MAG TPA: hypothetical protein VHD61_10555 [Lacunisphaera sp.]|nr:hypothetical protein [Lacunisphaera sp.]